MTALRRIDGLKRPEEYRGLEKGLGEGFARTLEGRCGEESRWWDFGPLEGRSGWRKELKLSICAAGHAAGLLTTLKLLNDWHQTSL